MEERRRKVDTLADALLDERFGRIVDKIDNLHQYNREQFAAVCTRMDKINGNVSGNSRRIESLENWRWYLIGGGTALIVIAEFIIRVV